MQSRPESISHQRLRKNNQTKSDVQIPRDNNRRKLMSLQFKNSYMKNFYQRNRQNLQTFATSLVPYSRCTVRRSESKNKQFPDANQPQTMMTNSHVAFRPKTSGQHQPRMQKDAVSPGMMSVAVMPNKNRSKVLIERANSVGQNRTQQNLSVTSFNVQEDYFSNLDTRMSNFETVSPRKQPKTGIIAIDMYYEGIDQANDVEYLRYQTQFCRLA